MIKEKLEEAMSIKDNDVNSFVWKFAKNKSTNVQEEIALVDGVIGVTAVPHFTNQLKPDVESLVDHIDYLRELVGTRHIALGFDFMNYLGDGHLESNLIDCQSASSANNVIDELVNRGYSSMDIDGITDIFIEPTINREHKVYFDTECGIAYIDIECDQDIFNHVTAFKETHLFDTK